MGLETPEFHPGYAALVLVFLAGCASLFKPKAKYKPLRRNEFKNYESSLSNFGEFCLARVQYWAIRFVFYYAIPVVAIGLYIITIALTIVISVSRINNDFHFSLDTLRAVEPGFCPNADLNDSFVAIAETTQRWSDQLTWFLIAYFFQVRFSQNFVFV